MGRALLSGAARMWLALAASAFAVLVMVMPSLLAAPTVESGSLTLAFVTAALAGLLRRDVGSVAAAATAGGTTSPRAGDRTPPLLTGRVTDPVHHPLRPRAPGTV